MKAILARVIYFAFFAVMAISACIIVISGVVHAISNFTIHGAIVVGSTLILIAVLSALMTWAERNK